MMLNPVQVDASYVVVGAVLIQEQKVIEYHSRALTSTQSDIVT